MEPLQVPLRNLPPRQSLLLHGLHAASDVVEHAPLRYFPDPQVLQVLHVVSAVPEHPPLLNLMSKIQIRSGSTGSEKSKVAGLIGEKRGAG